MGNIIRNMQGHGSMVLAEFLVTLSRASINVEIFLPFSFNGDCLLREF